MPASSATPSSTGSPAGSARRRGRSASRTTSPGRARHAGDRRVLRRRRPAPRLRHVPGAHRAELRVRLRLQGRAARSRDCGVARDDPRRARAQKTNAYQENRNLLLFRQGARGLDPGPRDPRERRALHARRDGRPGRPRAALLPDGARLTQERGGAPDRSRASSPRCWIASSSSRCARRSARLSKPAFRRASQTTFEIRTEP